MRCMPICVRGNADETARLIQINARPAALANNSRSLPENPMNNRSAMTENVYPFDARGIARRFRHSAIFGALGALEPGETMRFVNDHDPLPLLDQLRERFGERVQIEYQQRATPVVIDFRIVA